MAVYSIKELENLSGIKAHTIRIWEKRYKLIEPHRTTTNIRYYTDQELKKILNVAVLNRQGIKISNIARLTESELKNEIIRISENSIEDENLIDDLMIAMIDMDVTRFNELISRKISKTGFENTIKKTLYPFLEKVGILWQAGNINPAHEHFVSYLIRQKIIAAIEEIPVNTTPGSSKFLLFLPEGEWHELGLLFSQYILKVNGHEAIYLGQSVPYSDVLATGVAVKFDHILISSTIHQSEFNFHRYLKDLGGAFPDKKILYFSPTQVIDPASMGSNFYIIKSIEDLEKYLHTFS